MESVKERLQDLLGFEPLIVLTLLGAIAYFIYRTLLRKVNPSRHQMIRNLFGELTSSYLIFAAFWIFQFLIQISSSSWSGFIPMSEWPLPRSVRSFSFGPRKFSFSSTFSTRA
jgi:hypothetical protein